MRKKTSKEIKPAQIYTGRLKTNHLNPSVMDIYQLQINGNLVFNFSYLKKQPYDVGDIAKVFIEGLYSRRFGSRSFEINNGKLVDLASGAIIEAEELELCFKAYPLRVTVARGLLRRRGTRFGSI